MSATFGMPLAASPPITVGAMGAETPTCDARAERLRRVLDERYAALAAHPRNALDVACEPVQVRDHHGAGVVVDQLRDFLRVDVAQPRRRSRESARRPGSRRVVVRAACADR